MEDDDDGGDGEAPFSTFDDGFGGLELQSLTPAEEDAAIRYVEMACVYVW
jgi:hypothetical protein